MLTRKQSFLLLVICEVMMADSENQSPENSKVPFRESESLKNLCESMRGSNLIVTSRAADG